jgi:ribosome biogenesis GTPase
MDVLLKENLQYTFPDFASCLGQCQFHDCSHRKEPGCAVRQAVESGRIGKTRYESYLRLYEKAEQIKLWEIN